MQRRGSRTTPFPTRRSSDLAQRIYEDDYITVYPSAFTTYKITDMKTLQLSFGRRVDRPGLSQVNPVRDFSSPRSEEHTSELQSREKLVCRLLLEKKKENFLS